MKKHKKQTKKNIIIILFPFLEFTWTLISTRVQHWLLYRRYTGEIKFALLIKSRGVEGAGGGEGGGVGDGI